MSRYFIDPEDCNCDDLEPIGDGAYKCNDCGREWYMDSDGTLSSDGLYDEWMDDFTGGGC